MRIDLERAAIGFERTLLFADVLQDYAEPRERLLVARLLRNHDA